MMRRRRAVTQPMAQINVTSLLDITFVLLITFMIVTPALRYGVELELPEVTEAPVVNPSEPIAVTIHPRIGGAEIRVNGEVVEKDRVAERVRDMSAGGVGKQAITLDADRRVEWDVVAYVIASIKAQGIENIGIMTEVEDS